MPRLFLAALLAAALAPLMPTAAVAQQLDDTFTIVFDSFLRSGFRLSPGAHGNHYLPASVEANEQLAPALSSLIASNVASFPLSSTVAGVSFDFSSGQPVTVRESLGPIFAETAETLGDGKLVAGFNATYLGLDAFRGIPLDEMRFTFLHEDVNGTGVLGDNQNESDIVDIALDLNAEASIFALFATYGVTPNFDVGLAVPFVSLDLSGTAEATVESFTLGALGLANHHFGSDPTDPVLVKDTTYEARTTGVGDLALRFKYRLPVASGVRTALLADVRVPTGDDTNYLGTGSVSARVLLVGSRRFGDFTPHVNIGYDYRGAERDSDELELVVGFDQKVLPGLTVAADLIGAFDLQGDQIDLLPGTAVLQDRVCAGGQDCADGGAVVAQTTRTVARSNVPDWDYDHSVSAALGFRVAPTDQFQVLTNLLIPMTEGGLTSHVAPTVGFSIVF